MTTDILEKIEEMAKELYLKFFTEANLSESPDEKILAVRRDRCQIHAQKFYNYVNQNHDKKTTEG